MRRLSIVALLLALTGCATEPTTSAVPTSAPVSPPAAAAAPKPDTKEQVRKLWAEGADAKRRGDFVGARDSWREALRIDPGNEGIKGSLREVEQKVAHLGDEEPLPDGAAPLHQVRSLPDDDGLDGVGTGAQGTGGYGAGGSAPGGYGGGYGGGSGGSSSSGRSGSHRPPDGTPKSEHVSGYTRKDGTPVSGYDRRPSRR